MINKDHFLNLASAYVLNALDDKERAQFEEMLKIAPADLKEEYAKLQTAAQYLPLVAKQNEPPSELKKELITEIKKLSSSLKEEAAVPRPRSLFERVAHFIGLHRPQIAIVIIALLLIIAVGFIFFSSKLYYMDEAQQEHLISLKSNLKKKNALLSVLENRKINIIYLKGTALDSEAYGKIIFAPSTSKAFLLVSGLPVKPQHTYYQLWIKTQSSTLSAGVFNISDTSHTHYFEIDDLSKAEKTDLRTTFFVTLEHQADAQQPSDSLYLKN
ncbi:MAG TPA: anti-sigma factor [Balneolales bacterium]|nr:anti-sigma factor [Balneolales bacterium]